MRVPGIPYVQGRNRYDDVDGKKYGIAIHNTANNAPASGEASYATRRTDTVSSHFYCDRTQVIQSLDTDSRAGHAASRTGNENAIAVEITGTNDKSRGWWLGNVAWDELGRVLAVCCKKYGIAVRRASVSEMKSHPTVKAFYSHNDMRLAWGGTTHTDPGPNFPWDRLFSAVSAALDPTPEDDMFDDKDRDALTSANYRTYGLWQDLDVVDFTISSGRKFHETNVAKAARVALDKKLTAVLTALGGVDEAVATQLKTDFDQIDANLAAARAEVAEVDDQVLEQLGAADDPQEQANLLRAVLGDNAAAVGALLAQG